ncbi:hypothetical protein BFW01_g9715 [Lasiodiplodia theobromae]|nr:hypothetical protein BFW01_g9715 [Lasiodiplodia theobromae]
MSCLCNKLRKEQFSDITPSEVAVLQKALEQAPHLFAASDGKKRKRQHNYAALLKSYPDAGLHQLWRSEPVPQCPIPIKCTDVDILIYSTLEQLNRKSTMNKILKRAWCYAFSSLHPRNTDITPIVSKINPLFEETPEKIKETVYRSLRVGYKWQDIVSYSSKEFCIPEQDLTGIMCLLGKGNVWENSSAKETQAAVKQLGKATELFQEAKDHSSFINGILDDVKSGACFVNESVRSAQEGGMATAWRPSKFDHQWQTSTSGSTTRIGHSQESGSPTKDAAVANPNVQRSDTLGVPCRYTNFVESTPQTAGGAKSITAMSINSLSTKSVQHMRPSASGIDWDSVQESLPGITGLSSRDSNMLLIFICFLGKSEIAKHLFNISSSQISGKTRWNRMGEPEVLPPHLFGLDLCLESLLLDVPRLSGAIDELLQSSLLWTNDKSSATSPFVIDERAKTLAMARLDYAAHNAWRRQALIWAAYCFPRKHLVPQ